MRIAFVILAACSSSTKPPESPVSPPQEAPKSAGIACIPAGLYKVTVDLSAAKITQVNTGMDDITWCRSMLEGVPTMQMNALRIDYDDGYLAVHWPPSRMVGVEQKGECAIAIANQPIPATFTFADGRAEGIGTYSIGTVNHPDEKCTATDAKFFLERL